MKKVIPFLALLILVVPLKAHAGQGFAVVELFTSESCSSCPAADQFLIELTELAAKENQPIYTLGFHVDYWNYLNWVDEYSKPEFSHRQRTYAKKIRNSSVYTPQMIVNGKHQFGGYKKDLGIKYIDEAVLNEKGLDLAADLNVQDDKIQISAKLNQPSKTLILNAALVETSLSNNIRSGENAGRRLNHANVVREFKSVPADGGEVHTLLAVPADLIRENASVILYIQEKNTFEILAAAQLPLIS